VTLRRVLVIGAITVGAGSATAFAATLSVGSWHVWSGSQTLTKATCTLSGTASTTDTYVDENSPSSSFGGATTLPVSPKSGKRNWSFIRFDLSSCSIPSTGGADSATLTVHITTAPGSSRTIDVDSVGTSWSGTSTWTNAQGFSYGSVAGSFATGTTNNVNKSVTVTADVDALIKSGTANYGWRLIDNGASANVTTTFGAAENGTAGNRPTLVINYEK
jgi:hypothetical protein